MSNIKENFLRVMERIERAAQRVGRDPKEVKLVAVSKTVEVDRIKEAIEAPFGLFDRLPHRIGWLSDNGSAYIASATRPFATGVELVVCTTPIGSPESNGVAQAFIKTFKRDYVALHRSGHPRVILEQLPEWFKVS